MIKCLATSVLIGGFKSNNAYHPTIRTLRCHFRRRLLLVSILFLSSLRSINIIIVSFSHLKAGHEEVLPGVDVRGQRLGQGGVLGRGLQVHQGALLAQSEIS